MPRPLRYQPKPWTVFFVTQRCFQRRFLLLPTSGVTPLIIGVLARGAELYPVRLHLVEALANHYHLMISAPSARVLSHYLSFVAGNIAREIGRRHGWKGKFWHGRHHRAPCLDDEACLERLGYGLIQGVKERLVSHATRWPGLQSYGALVEGQRLHGTWVDRTALGKARAKKGGAQVREADFTRTTSSSSTPSRATRGSRPPSAPLPAAKPTRTPSPATAPTASASRWASTAS